MGSAFPPGGGHPKLPDTTKTSEVVSPTSLPNYKSVQIRILSSNQDTLPVITLEAGKKVELKSQGVTLQATDFYNHWKIKGKDMVNASKNETNPAVKIVVTKKDSVLYTGWAFKNIPFFGANNMMGHKNKGMSRLYFTLVSYDELKWK